MTTRHNKSLYRGLPGIALLGVVVSAAPGSVQAKIEGLTGASFAFSAGAAHVSTADGGSIPMWGYQDTAGLNVPQYPGPTLILQEDVPVTITLTSGLPHGQCTSMLFPGHTVSATGGSAGILTQEACPPAGGNPGTQVTYTFTPTEPGTYTYYSGTNMALQVEMGLVGTIVVRPGTGANHAYNDPATAFDHEYLFFMSQMDPKVHELAAVGSFGQIDMSAYWPVYWFLNGRTAPDTLAAPYAGHLLYQPYDSRPRMTPGDKVLMRLVGGDQGQHPFHFHGNNADVIARDGRLLKLGATLAPRSQFTTLSVPGETADQIFTWTGAKLGWDIYGHAPGDPMQPNEYAPDHGKSFPVVLPENQNLAFGGFWSGSPFLGSSEALPPGEGGLNPFSAYTFMWHSHTEKELTNYDIFPGGLMTMLFVEPPGTPIE